MTLSKDNQVSKIELLNRFREVVRDHVIANTSWDGTTVIRSGLNLASITGNEAQSTKFPPEENLNQVEPKITANIDSTQSFVRAIRDIMSIYSRNLRISVRNTGNSPGGLDYYINGVFQYYNPYNYYVTQTATARLNRDYNNVTANVISDVNAAVSNRNLNTKDVLVDASDIENFFNDCKNIWNSRCAGGSNKTYDYNYCHGSFNAHSSHSSRGRR